MKKLDPSSTLTTLLLTLVCIVTPVLAEPAEENTWRDNFTIRGEVTLAWIDVDLDEGLDFPPVPFGILGLTEESPSTYGNALLNASYRQGRNRFVLQLSTRRWGDARFTSWDVQEEQIIDWLFWQRRLGANGHLQLGRIPLEAGISNLYRDARALEAFYHPSFGFYAAGQNRSETIDGLALERLFWPESDWELSFNFSYGFESTAFEDVAVFEETPEMEISDSVSLQLWLSTPVEGLRFGLGGQSYEVEDSITQLRPERWDTWYVSIDGDFPKWLLRAEFSSLENPTNAPDFGIPEGMRTIEGGYLEIGRRWDRVQVTARYDYRETQFDNPPLLFEFSDWEDLALAVTVPFSVFEQNFLLGLEYHGIKADQAEGFTIDSEGRIVGINRVYDNGYTFVRVSFSF